MQRISNGEPLIHKHSCSAQNKGHLMTDTELLNFSIDILISEYRDTGMTVVKRDKHSPNEADFYFENGGLTVNVMVILKKKIDNDISNVDTDWLVTEYKKSGAIPRITLVNSWCFSSDSGQPAVCGADFCFKYYSLSVLPNEEDNVLEQELSPIELAQKYVESWKQMDATIVEPYLSKDFHYGSDWVFDEMPSRYEYIIYFKGKLETIRQSGSHLVASLGHDPQTDEVAVMLEQDNKHSSSLILKTSDGRIMSACMKEYDERFKIIDYQDELYQNHGDHIQAIMPTPEFMTEHLSKIISESKLLKNVETEVTMEEMRACSTHVFSLLYGDGLIQMLTIIAYSPICNVNHFITVYPVMKGQPYIVQISKVLEWDNQVEATILCSIGDFDFAFFAVDYYANKNIYVAGKQISVNLSALGCQVEEAQREFSFEGQQAVDWLAKIGEHAQIDESGNIEPIHFSLEKLVAFFNHDSKCPDEGEFQSPTYNVSCTSLLGKEFFKTTICIHRDENDNEIQLPLYFIKDSFPKFKVGDPIRGWLWIIGSITE